MVWNGIIISVDFSPELFLSNSVPHFAKGICDDKFPTPFAKLHGKGQPKDLRANTKNKK